MIEFDEEEYFTPLIDKGALRALLNFVPDIIPREVYDKLLYSGEGYVRISSGNVECNTTEWIPINHGNQYHNHHSEAKKTNEEIEGSVQTCREVPSIILRGE